MGVHLIDFPWAATFPADRVNEFAGRDSPTFGEAATPAQRSGRRLRMDEGGLALGAGPLFFAPNRKGFAIRPICAVSYPIGAPSPRRGTAREAASAPTSQAMKGVQHGAQFPFQRAEFGRRSRRGDGRAPALNRRGGRRSPGEAQVFPTAELPRIDEEPFRPPHSPHGLV